jgi:cytidylate kinase
LDQEILERVAKVTKTDEHYLRPHDEQTSAAVSSFLNSLIRGTSATLDTYRRALYQVVLEMSEKDCIIIGRGAHLILGEEHAFRLRIVGSKRVCAARIATQHHLSLAQAESEVHEINQKRHDSILNVFSGVISHCSLENATLFDLVINTDHFSPENAMSLVLMAIKLAGYELKKEKSS